MGDFHPRIVAVAAALAIAACSSSSSSEDQDRHQDAPAAQVGYGTVMAEVGRRFELFGRAATAERYELADYELGEIEEAFTEALPNASPPKEGHPEVLPDLVSGFVGTNVPELHRSVASHDPARITQAFEDAAAACNACHHASGHAFIVVPRAPGHSIPDTDPPALPPPPAPASQAPAAVP